MNKILIASQLRGYFFFFKEKVMKTLGFYIYAKLHKAFQNAKFLKDGHVDADILNLVREKNKIEQKYNGISINQWKLEDIERINIITQHITCYMKGLNVAESILQKIGKPNSI